MGVDNAVSIYEVEPGSWMRVPEEGNRPLRVEEIGPKLADYVKGMGFTHVLLLERGFDCNGLAQDLGSRGVGVISGADVSSWNRHVAAQVLSYFERDPFFRKFEHAQIANCDFDAQKSVLALSHEEFELGKPCLLARMPGDPWQKFANLRLLFAYLFLQPVKKLLFMGQEFGQAERWRPDQSLDWHLLDQPFHKGLQRWVAHLNHLYRSERAAHEGDTQDWGLDWIDQHDAEQSTLAWLRHSAPPKEQLIAVLNFTPVPRPNHRVGAPAGGFWREILNSDATEYGGSGVGNFGGVQAAPFDCHGRPYTLTLTLPPLGAVVFKPAG